MIKSKMNSEYRKRVRKIRSAVRGKYPAIAVKSGFSIDTVRAVMAFKFRNDAIIDVAEELGGGVTE